MAQAAHAHDPHRDHHAAPPAEGDAGAGWFAPFVLMILTTAFLLLAILLPRPEMTAGPRPLVRAVAPEAGTAAPVPPATTPEPSAAGPVVAK